MTIRINQWHSFLGSLLSRVNLNDRIRLEPRQVLVDMKYGHLISCPPVWTISHCLLLPTTAELFDLFDWGLADLIRLA